MKYVQPYGVNDANASYVDGNPALGIEGSAVPAAALEHPMRELVYLIAKAGITPDGAKLTQVYEAIQALILEAMPQAPEKYELCEFYPWRHPTLKPGFQPAQGGLLANAATLYPKAWAYLHTVEGQVLCKTESEWQAMTTATWATLADGTKVGWNGIGGAPFYAPDTATGALRLPDLRGMYAEAAGFDSLGVGGVHGDGGRRLYAASSSNILNGSTGSNNPMGFGAWEWDTGIHRMGLSSSAGGYSFAPSVIDSQRTAPSANKNQPRAWGALACIYLGLPASL